MTEIAAIDYVLGELDAQQRANAERRLREDAAFRREVERLSPVVARLEALPRDGWESLEPPPLRMPADAARAPARRRERRRLVLRPGVAVAASLALLGGGVAGGVVAVGGGGGEQAAAPPIALSAVSPAGQGASGEATVVRDSESTIRLELHGLAPTSRADAYEAWLMDDTKRLVSLGSFRVGPSGSATVTLPTPVAPGRYRFVDVSRERLDGNPGHSGSSVLRGPTRA
jgi:anti-sigma-K factor RskA